MRPATETWSGCLLPGRQPHQVFVLLLLLCLACTHREPAVQPSPPQPPAADRLRRDILGLTDSAGVHRASWGISVRSLDTAETLVDINAERLLVPASISKLVALAAAVDARGWDYSFETTVRATGPVVDGVLRGDLIVVGSGDPSVGGRAGEDFTSWIDALRRAGITRIDGRIVGDDDALDEPRPGAMWAWDDLGYTSGALFGALNYAENRMLVTVAPGSADGTPATLTVAAAAQDRPLVNRVVTGAPGSPARLWPEQRPGETALTIAGSLPLDARPVRMSVSAGDPTRWFVGVLRHELEHAGIPVTGEAVDLDDLMPRPDVSKGAVIFVHRSRPLAEIAHAMLKDSINLYAEALLRLSSEAGGSNDNALATLAGRLPTWGVAADALQVVDGSGLSRRDALAAGAIAQLLAERYDPTFQSPWMQGLPVAGRDGTLDDRMRNTAAESNVRAKTGTMSNIRSLAGYVFTRDHEPLAFAIVVNNFEGTGQEATAAVDAMATRLAEFSRGR